jgi:hypothetical protein
MRFLLIAELDRVGEALASLSKGRPAFAEAASRRQAKVAPAHLSYLLSAISYQPLAILYSLLAI